MFGSVWCVLRLHKWVNRRNDSGQGFRVCARCGAEQEAPAYVWRDF